MGVVLMPGEIDQISLAIGKLESGMETLAVTVRDNQEASTREHRIVHDIVVATSEAVRNLAAKVAEIEPLTSDYREKRAEKRGATRLVHWLYVSGGGIAGAITAKAIEIFGAKPPHI